MYSGFKPHNRGNLLLRLQEMVFKVQNFFWYQHYITFCSGVNYFNKKICYKFHRYFQYTFVTKFLTVYFEVLSRIILITLLFIFIKQFPHQTKFLLHITYNNQFEKEFFMKQWKKCGTPYCYWSSRIPELEKLPHWKVMHSQLMQ